MLNLCCRTCDEVWDGPSEDTACPFCGSRDVWGETMDAPFWAGWSDWARRRRDEPNYEEER
jgi:hypothetical protein